VQLAGASGASLPGADATGTLNLSATAGKVVLATGAAPLGCNGGSSPCTAAQLARVVDLVGFGSANFFEGTAAAAGLSNTTAAVRAADGCTDTDQNSTDFAVGAPAPRSSATAATPCGAGGTPGTPGTPAYARRLLPGGPQRRGRHRRDRPRVRHRRRQPHHGRRAHRAADRHHAGRLHGVVR
jgi:hypothetical protein